MNQNCSSEPQKIENYLRNYLLNSPKMVHSYYYHSRCLRGKLSQYVNAYLQAFGFFSCVPMVEKDRSRWQPHLDSHLFFLCFYFILFYWNVATSLHSILSILLLCCHGRAEARGGKETVWPSNPKLSTVWPFRKKSLLTNSLGQWRSYMYCTHSWLCIFHLLTLINIRFKIKMNRTL